MKPLAFVLPHDLNTNRLNWETFMQSSNSGKWSPTTIDINNVGSTDGFFQVYGPIVFYWIKLTYNGTNMTAGVNPRISNLPYGPNSVSGQKLLAENQVSLTARAGAAGASESLSSTNDAWATSTGGVSYIYLPPTWTAAVTQYIWVQGWILRE